MQDYNKIMLLKFDKLKRGICGFFSIQGFFKIVFVIFFKCIIYDYKGRLKNFEL